MTTLDLSSQRKEGAHDMQLDPYIHLQMHEQELRRKMTQNALERQAREARLQLTEVSAGRPRVKARASRRAVLVGAVAAITRVFGLGRQAI
jgi:hypothetical protein